MSDSPQVTELRLVVTAPDYDQALRFYGAPQRRHRTQSGTKRLSLSAKLPLGRGKPAP